MLLGSESQKFKESGERYERVVQKVRRQADQEAGVRLLDGAEDLVGGCSHPGPAGSFTGTASNSAGAGAGSAAVGSSRFRVFHRQEPKRNKRVFVLNGQYFHLVQKSK